MVLTICKWSCIYFLVVGCTLSSIAQIKEETQAMSQGVANGFTVVLPQVQKKVADDLWKDYIRKYGGKYKYDKKSQEHQSMGAIIGTISASEPLNVYASIREVGAEMVLTVWLQNSRDFISSSDEPGAFEAIELQLAHFARETAREKLRLELREEERHLSKIESEMQRLVKRKENLELEIEKAKKRIEEAEAEIEVNQSDQSKTRVTIKSQEEVVKELRQRLSDM
jgi:translation initiation factor 2B subunit (eIF-2B alpha/beta/delta family)